MEARKDPREGYTISLERAGYDFHDIRNGKEIETALRESDNSEDDLKTFSLKQGNPLSSTGIDLEFFPSGAPWPMINLARMTISEQVIDMLQDYGYHQKRHPVHGIICLMRAED